ncbi:MAG: hypothetical protein LBS60_04955 [Deltaproteobacteria bacterium]|nr:hypothetical protein [Deltaproteobacteria bacterium]
MSRKTKKVVNRASTALRLAAQSLWNSKSVMGDLFRKLRSIKGPQKAITAMAHKLARIISAILTKGEAYLKEKLAVDEEKVKERSIRKLKAKAASFGFKLVESSKELSGANIEAQLTDKADSNTPKRVKASGKHKKSGNMVSSEFILSQLLQKGIIGSPATERI